MIAVGSIEYSGYKETLVYEKIKCDEIEYVSGDFIKDWYDLMLDIFKYRKYEHVVFSSTLDHFFFDGADYDSAYLINVKDDFWDLIYIDSESMLLLDEHNIVDKGVEIFIPSGTKMTWEEYKLAYKDNL